MKTCADCRQTKPLEEFGTDAGRSDGRNPYCRVCKRRQGAEYRQRHRVKERARHAARQASRTRFIQAVKLTVGCVDCGYADDPAELHFDHRDGETKEFNIAVGWGLSLTRIVAEIEKCEVRCNPCHQRRHGLKRGGLQRRRVA